MIQINEKDTLWFFYTSFYKRETPIPPHPKNLCNYFWKAIGGFFVWVLLDSFFILAIMLLAVFFALGLSPWFLLDGQDLPAKIIQLLGGAFVLFTGFICFCSLVSRIVDCVGKDHKDEVHIISASVVIFSFLVVVATLCVRGDNAFSFWHLGEGVLWVIGGLIVVIGLVVGYVCGVHDSNLRKNIKQYFKAWKDKTCPIVKPPESWCEKEREMYTNYSDS